MLIVHSLTSLHGEDGQEAVRVLYGQSQEQIGGEQEAIPIKAADEWAAAAYEKAAIGHGHGETSKRDVEPHNGQKIPEQEIS